MTRQKEEARREAGLKGLYRSELEHDACGVGAVVNIKGRASHKVIEDALLILHNLDHRGAVGADPLCGDGAGILIQIPDAFYREEMRAQGVELPAVGDYVIRKTASHRIQALKLTHGSEYFVPSMSTRTVVYKGLLLAD